MKRSNYCANITALDIGKEISVSGFTAKMRNLGGFIFIDLRDRTGIVQCTLDEAKDKELFDRASQVRSEFVLSIKGIVKKRDEKSINPKMITGEIEIQVTHLDILSKAQTPPFEINDKQDVSDRLRLKYRYLDLRRASMQQNMMLRHRVTQITRNYFDENGFLEIETPMLTKSTPEGARDYLVPSRVHKGEFYALPQSPQQYKQLLMLSGFDRYMQITRCFRDEDLRADRQPEFTQIDLEMSFVDENDIMDINEGYLKKLFKEIHNVDVDLPLPRMEYDEAMNSYGCDKPDIRFGFLIKDISHIAKKSEFKVFRDTVDNGGTVRLININGYADKYSRKEIDALVEVVKTYGGKGLAWMKIVGDDMTSTFAKFLTEDEVIEIKSVAGASDNDLILIVADTEDTVLASLGALRCHIAKKLDILDKNDYKLLWVTNFPLFEFDKEDNRYVAKHHPFTAPVDEDIELLDTQPEKVRAKAYDIILNGTELGGGSVRIHKPEIQELMFRKLGFTDELANEQFGHLIDAFKYGAPPHGGLAYGLDRICMLLLGLDSIRDVIAFPKVQNASCLMSHCPSAVSEKQLDETHLKIKE